MENLNPMQKDGATKIERIDGNKHRVTMKDGDQFIVDGDNCECGHERDYTPSRSAGFKQSYRKRRQASCPHQVAVLNAENLGPCPSCGNYVVTENEMYHQGRHVMSKYLCANCGEKVSME